MRQQHVTFDLYLEPREGEAADGPAILDALSRIEGVHETVDDPTRLIYRNADTTVHFALILDHALIPHGGDDSQGDGDWDDDEGSGRRPRGRGVLPEAEDLEDQDDDDDWEDDEDDEDTNSEGGEDEDEDEGEDEDEDEDEEIDASAARAAAEPIEALPVVVSIPLFRPAFFIREALELVAYLRETTGLLVVDPQEGGAGGGEPGAWSDDEVIASWERTNRSATAAVKDPSGLQVWSPETCEAFWLWGRHREDLRRELEADGHEVPVLQPAAHDGRTRSLCVWDTTVPTALPPSDIVLVRRPREKRGLLRRRQVVEERLVDGSSLWALLSRHAQCREKPAPCLVLPDWSTLPTDIEAGLDELESWPVESARRTELVGVIDFEIDPPSGHEAEAS